MSAVSGGLAIGEGWKGTGKMEVGKRERKEKRKLKSLMRQRKIVYTHRLSQLASLLRRVQNLVKKDGEIEGQSQPNGVGRLHFRLGDVISVLVRFLRILHNG